VAGNPFHSLGEALRWLDDHIDFESSMPSRRSLPTLERMQEMTTLLGDPQRAYPVIHLTGTNGKGSTAAMTTALLGSNGLSVGTYTSPNLAVVNERISRNGISISDDALSGVLGALFLLEPLLTERPTRFELLTAAALAWFAEEAVEAAVVEVGLGGSWDSTNVVDGQVCVITNISYDHTEVLGPTLEGIASDKAGIIKAGSTVVVGEIDPGLVRIISDRAEQVGANEVWLRGTEFDCTSNRLAVGGRLVDLRSPGGEYSEVLIPLRGPHQGVNGACALAAAEAFFGGPLDETVVDEGFAAVVVAGRLEVVGRHPLCLLDGAHNVAGMEALASALEEEFAIVGPGVAVIGMLGGRDPSAMLAPLRRAGLATVVACAPDSPRALSSDVVGEAARALGFEVVVTPTVNEAVETGRGLAGSDGLMVVAGSLYVVADARSILLEAAGRP
jgi:dihydrofolate synthase / folylpolyglutamate synthase